MPKKDDLITQASSMGIEGADQLTVAELEEQIEAKRIEMQAAEDDPEPPGELTRRRFNRGSRRRVEREMRKLDKAIEEAVREFDLQAFLVDEDGNRIGEWPLVTELRAMRAAINERVNSVLMTTEE